MIDFQSRHLLNSKTTIFNVKLFVTLFLVWAILLPAVAVAQKNPVRKDKDGLDTYLDPDFVPPPLKELDAKTKWVKGEVKDVLKHYEAFVAKQPPSISYAEAIKLKNNSKADDDKILGAMRYLPNNKEKANLDAVMNHRIKGDVTSTNILKGQTFEDFDLEVLMGIGMIGFDWDMKTFANSDVVTSWETSSDYLYDKIILRDDLVWSDGKPITAHDVEFTFQLIMRPNVPIPAVRSQVDELKYIHAYDDRTVVVFHKKALASRNWSMVFSILPKHVYENTWQEDPTLVKSDAHKKLEDEPVVGGPYKIVKRTFQKEILFERREDYYMYKGKQVRDIPYLKQIRFRVMPDINTSLLALKRGDLDDMEFTSLEQWKNQTNDDAYYERNTKAYEASWTYYYFGWNLIDPKDDDKKRKNPFFADRNVRLAMTYAFNHKESIEKLNYGLVTPSLGPMPWNSWIFPNGVGLKPYNQDIDKSLDLLEKAGWEDTDEDGILDKVVDGEKIKFEFTMLVLNDPSRMDNCTLLKNTLDRMGIKCNVHPVELTVMPDRLLKHNFDAFFGGWGAGADPDTAENVWTTSAIKDGRNYVSYSNKHVDGLFELGKLMPIEEKERERIVKEFELEKVGITAKADRPAIYAKINEIVYEDQPYTFAFYKSNFYGFNKELRGYHFSPRGPFHYGPGFSSFWRFNP